MDDERVFTMPDLGEGLDEGEVVAWLVSEGDTVALNQPLVEVETAKATVEIPSPVAGSVVSLHATAGESVAVGAPLVTFSASDGVVGGGGSAGQSRPNPSSATTADLRPSGVERPTVGSAERVAATPPVRKLAKELGVDLGSVRGTGPGGRISAEDVKAAAAGSGPPGGAAVGAKRRAIAANLERQAAIPQVTVFRTVECSALESLRRDLAVSPLAVVVAGLTRVVGSHPQLNARWVDGGVEERTDVHVGMAVDTERGLVVAVAREAAERGITDLATEIKRLAEGARSGTLTPQEMTGATIAVSNTGSYGSEAGTPILSPGTSITLALGVIEPRAMVVDDVVTARPACTLSCTFDHRVLDGADLGLALNDLVALLENADALGDLPR